MYHSGLNKVWDQPISCLERITQWSEWYPEQEQRNLRRMAEQATAADTGFWRGFDLTTVEARHASQSPVGSVLWSSSNHVPEDSERGESAWNNGGVSVTCKTT